MISTKRKGAVGVQTTTTKVTARALINAVAVCALAEGKPNDTHTHRQAGMRHDNVSSFFSVFCVCGCNKPFFVLRSHTAAGFHCWRSVGVSVTGGERRREKRRGGQSRAPKI